MPHQEALTVIARISPGQVPALKALLGTIADHGERWDIVPFAQLDDVHFARFVVFDESTDLDGNPLAAQLALMTNVDAPLDGHLDDLVTTCGAGLDRPPRWIALASQPRADAPTAPDRSVTRKPRIESVKACSRGCAGPW